jgi:hypothetical protein
MGTSFLLVSARDQTYVRHVPKRATLSNERFLRRVQEYLPMDAAIWNTDERSRPCCEVLPATLKAHRFYLFDAEAIHAMTHAISELALEAAEGSLWGCLQTFREYESHREHCWQLAATLGEVRVFGEGRLPARHGRVRFVPGQGRGLGAYWAVIYQGARTQIALVGRQVKPARQFVDRQFLGFYTLEAAVVSRLRADLEALAQGKARSLAEHTRLQGLDQAGKALRCRFDFELHSIEAELARLRSHPGAAAASRLESAGERMGGRLGLFVQELARLGAVGGERTRS